MYYAFFGLAHPPFKITPDTDVFFEGGNRGAILEALIYAVSNGEGIIKVTGEVGSGKTMLCRVLQTRLPPNVETVYLANPSVSPEEILHAIAFELQLPIAKDSSRLEVMHALNTYLLERHAAEKQVVVFVEESQGMPLATLEEIRLLSNLETQHYKLLQIILFGQPELDQNLSKPQIRQLRERITHSFSLSPLEEADVRAYLSFRLRAAGYRGPDLFSGRVIAYLTRASGGLTRRINLVADKALLAAFADNTHNVGLKHIKAAVRDSEFSEIPAGSDRARYYFALGGVALGCIIGALAFAGYQAWIAPPEPAQVTAAPATPLAAGPAPAEPIAVPAADQSISVVLPASALPPVAPEAIEPSSVASAVRAPISLPDDILEQRLLFTDQWLEQQDASAYSIQLLGTNDPELLREYFKTIGKYLEIEKVFVYRTLANQRPSLTVLYGTFSTLREVNQVLNELPDELKANRPYFRTLQGIRSEIARYKS
jgi:MSHA biogenesis protein MshM